MTWSLVDRRRYRRLNVLEREPLLLAALVLLAVAFFVGTTFAARFYHRKQAAFGEQWFRRGEAALRQAHPGTAVEYFRNALAYSQENDRYRLRLAQALLAAGRPQEAVSHLRELWDKEPGNGIVNLELGRLAARQGNVPQAMRFYHGAIFGAWPQDPERHRLETRLELSEFLLAQHASEQAHSELVALAARLPQDNPDLHERVGDLFLQAGSYARALYEFRAALQIDPQRETAAAGAGEAAFLNGDYRTAQRFLRRAVQANLQDRHSAELLATADLVISQDPFQPRLRAAERARRAVQAFHTARARVEQCAHAEPQPELLQILERMKKTKRSARAELLRRNPDAMDKVMELVFDGEATAARHCGKPRGADLALLLLAKQREATEP
ncbi:MAG TPA: tetratricopeptide repeat protein [Longimicrobiales bacterium]|nr:tetratricopeptide repeat protein [Longimicrobiales bacterium]